MTAPPASPLVRQAQGLYLLRQFQSCVDLLEPCAAEPGAARWLGLAKGRLGEMDGSIAALEVAVAAEPALQASLLSARLRRGETPEWPVASPAGPLGELCAAASWRRGQQRLDAGVAAARELHLAARLFRSESPPRERPERLTACLIPATVALLVAGEFDAAQQAYARIAGDVPLPEHARRFSRLAYELAAELRAGSAAERASAAAELAELAAPVRLVRLHVAFYDGERPVQLHWEGLP